MCFRGIMCIFECTFTQTRIELFETKQLISRMRREWGPQTYIIWEQLDRLQALGIIMNMYVVLNITN